jgi:hypothetical protein
MKPVVKGTFATDDRTFHTEYAFKAITAANIMSIGVRGKDCAVVLSQKKVPVSAFSLCPAAMGPQYVRLKLTPWLRTN